MARTATKAAPKKEPAISYGSKTKVFEVMDLEIEGTAPLLVAHAMPWDIGGKFWEGYPREVQESKNIADVLSPIDRQLLKRLGFEINGRVGADAEAHLRGHWLPDLRPAFPSSGFMRACLTAVVQYKGKGRSALTAKKVGGGMQILGDDTDRSLVEIKGEVQVSKPDIGRMSGIGGAPRIITRLRFEPGWRAVLRAQYITEILSAQDIVQVVAWAGNWGVGQWRPSSPHPGPPGTWRLVDSQ